MGTAVVCHLALVFAVPVLSLDWRSGNESHSQATGHLKTGWLHPGFAVAVAGRVHQTTYPLNP